MSVNIYNSLQNWWSPSGYANGKAMSGIELVEASIKQACYNSTVKGMTVKLSQAPGLGAKQIFTLRRNGVNTAVQVVISDLNTYGYIDASTVLTTSHLDTLSLQQDRVGNPARCTFSVSLTIDAGSDYQVSVNGSRIGNQANTNLGNTGTISAFGSPVFNNNAVGWEPGSAGGINTANQEKGGWQSLLSTPGTLKNFRVLLDAGIHPADPTKHMLFGFPSIGPQLFSIAGNATYGESGVNTAHNNAGDFVVLYANTDDVSPTYQKGVYTIDFVPDNAGCRNMCCDLLPQAGKDTFHSGIGCYDAGGEGVTVGVGNDVSDEPFIVVPTDGVITNLFVNSLVAPSNGNPLTITIRKNGVDTALTLTLTNPTISGSNTTSPISVSRGDTLSIKARANATGSWGGVIKPKIAWTFIPTNHNYTPVFMANFNKVALTGTAGTIAVLTNPVDGTGLCKYLASGQVRKLVSSVSGITHLKGQIVNVVADGSVVEQHTVDNTGAITLDAPAAVVHVGLPYTGKIKLLPLGGDTKSISEGKKRKMYDVMLRLWKTLGGKFGQDEDSLFPLDIPPQDESDVLFTGDLHQVSFESSFEDVWEPVFEQDQPLPCMILAMVIRSEISEDK